MKQIAAGKLITATGDVLENATVTVDDAGTIRSVNRDAAAAGEVLDWSRYTVIPGMIDAHDHLSIDLGDEEAQSKESVTTHVLKSVRNARDILHAGITTLRDVGARGYIDVELRDAIARGEIEGPRLLVSGEFITRTGGHAWYFTKAADGVDAVRTAVRDREKHRVDLIKVMASGGVGTPYSDPKGVGYSQAELATIIEEAHALGLKVSAHIHGGPTALWAIEAGLDTLEHGIYLTEEDLQAMLRHGTYLIVTYGLIDEALRKPGVPEFFIRKATEAKASYMNVIRRAIELGVKIAVGGDTYHADMPDELAGLVEGGMTPEQAIAAATRNGAEACGILDQVGTIEVGKAADLVALADDPLKDVRAVGSVVGVVQGGKVVRTPA